MQDRYTGDIGDYAKYGLLRALSEGQRLGVAWYLFPNEDHNKDGRHTDYLQDPSKWRGYDPALYDALKQIVDCDKRKVSAVEKSGILGAAEFSSDILSISEPIHAKRRIWRLKWFENIQTSLLRCNIVFADPDNGLCEDNKFNYCTVKGWKRMPLQEAKALARGRTAVIYHHNTRRPGGHKKEIEYWIELLGQGTLAFHWRRYGSRTFFIVNPTQQMRERLECFSHKWEVKSDIYGLSS